MENTRPPVRYRFIKPRKHQHNSKLGPIPAVYSSRATCPPSCPLYEHGCYAGMGAIHVHWLALDRGVGAIDIDRLCGIIRALPKRQLWRYGTAGDLPGVGEEVDFDDLDKLVDANRGRRGWTYTHKSPLGNREIAEGIKRANENGFTINLSADDIHEADELADLGIGPVVVTLPSHAPDHPTKTPQGRTVAVCPAQRRTDVRCSDCGLCAVTNRKVVIGFRAHGPGKQHINRRLKRSSVFQG